MRKILFLFMGFVAVLGVLAPSVSFGGYDTVELCTDCCAIVWHMRDDHTSANYIIDHGIYPDMAIGGDVSQKSCADIPSSLKQDNCTDESNRVWYALNYFVTTVNYLESKRNDHISWWDRECAVATQEKLVEAIQLAMGVPIKETIEDCVDSFHAEFSTDGWWHSHICTVGMVSGNSLYKIFIKNDAALKCKNQVKSEYNDGSSGASYLAVRSKKTAIKPGDCIVSEDGDYAWRFINFNPDIYNSIFSSKDVKFLKRIKPNGMTTDSSIIPKDTLKMNPPRDFNVCVLPEGKNCVVKVGDEKIYY